MYPSAQSRDRPLRVLLRGHRESKIRPPTFYMACGWHRGYFGMQVNSPTEHAGSSSASGTAAAKPSIATKVGDDNRVKLMGKGGQRVFTGDFGNEGTGGHSHLKYDVEDGRMQRFLLPQSQSTKPSRIYSGYWFHPEQRQWMLISSWKAPKEGGWMRGST